MRKSKSAVKKHKLAAEVNVRIKQEPEIFKWLEEHAGSTPMVKVAAVVEILRGVSAEDLRSVAARYFVVADGLNQALKDGAVQNSQMLHFVKESTLLGEKRKRSKIASSAIKARHEREQKSLDEKRDQLRAAWRSGKYQTHEHCVFLVAPKLGLKESTARRALAGLPNSRKK